MCEYIKKSELTKPKETFQEWVNKVHKVLKKDYGLTFQVTPIGSGSRNMVVKKCNFSEFDLDYQIKISKHKKVNIDNAKKIKQIFKDAFDNNKPTGFSCCEDSTQALTTINKSMHYSFDIIITIIKENGDFCILYNNKNRNSANNKDYEWQIKKDMNKHKENFDKIEGPAMWNDLRESYLNKKHTYSSITDKNDPKYKHSYQILNEAVNETLKKYNIQISE